MDLKLTGRSVMITGASKGIGLGIGKWFASEGVNLCLVARSGDLLAKEAEAIRKAAQVNVQTLAADLSDPAARRKVFETFPDVDIVVNNAGAIPGGTIEDVDEKAWRAGWDLKVYAHVDFTRLYLAKMKARRRGVIINIIGAGGEKLTHNAVVAYDGSHADERGGEQRQTEPETPPRSRGDGDREDRTRRQQQRGGAAAHARRRDLAKGKAQQSEDQSADGKDDRPGQHR